MRSQDSLALGILRVVWHSFFHGTLRRSIIYLHKKLEERELSNAMRLYNNWNSGADPPVAEKASGANVPISTSNKLSTYVHLFPFRFSRGI